MNSGACPACGFLNVPGTVMCTGCRRPLTKDCAPGSPPSAPSSRKPSSSARKAFFAVLAILAIAMFAGVVREAFERPKREAARLTEFEAKVEAGRVAIQQGNLAEAEKRLGDALDFLGRNADMLRGVNPAGFASLREQCRIAGSTPKVEDTILSMTDEEFKQYASTGRIEGRVYFDDPDVNRYFVRVLETRRPDAARLRAEETKRKTEELKRQALAEKEAERESKRREQSLRADMVSAREKYADILERQYLDQGMDIYVSVSGPDKTTIKLEYVLMSRPLAHQFSNNDAALSALRSLGFRKLVFSNKQEVWTMSL